jgi:predicted  nucleic acid-binding Zn-ribbon protein
MVDAILVLSKKVDKQISDTLQEIEELKAAIEADKSSMQAVEAQMKQIRPSIDLSNPESAWYFTVNIR